MAIYRHDEVFPIGLSEREFAAINLRREQADLQYHETPTVAEHEQCTNETCVLRTPNQCPKRVPVNLLGVALSGGGIRSATFALGVLQSLARRDQLKRVDYLSTVSGGGYTGAFLGRLFTRTSGDNGETFRRALQKHSGCSEHAELNREPPQRSGIIRWVLTNPSSPPLDWLRENGRYLSPNGSGDTMLGIAVAVRNWFAARMPLWTFALTFFVFVNLARALAFNYGESVLGDVEKPIYNWHIWWAPTWRILYALILALVSVAWAYWLVPLYSREGTGYFLIRAHVLLIVAALVAPDLYPSVVGSKLSNWTIGCSVFVLLISVLIFMVLGREAIKFVMRVFLLVFAVGLIALLIPKETRGLEEIRIHILPQLMFANKGQLLEPPYSLLGVASALAYFVAASILLEISWAIMRAKFAAINLLNLGWRQGVCVIAYVGCIAAIVALAAGFGLGIGPVTWAEFLCLTSIVALVGSAIHADSRTAQRWVCGVGCHGLMIIMALVAGFSPAYKLLKFETLVLLDWFSILASSALGLACLASVLAQPYVHASQKQAFGGSIEKVRHDLSVWMRNVMIAAALIGGIFVIDSLGQTIYSIDRVATRRGGHGFEAVGNILLAAFGLILMFVTASQKLAVAFLGSDTSKKVWPGWQFVGLMLGLTLVLVELVMLNFFSHAIAWRGMLPPQSDGSAAEMKTMTLSTLVPCAIMLALITWTHGRLWRTVNHSTFNPLYASRLTRAYLGASNSDRWSGPEQAVTQVSAGDGADLGEYVPHRSGGPLHLINVTINETASGRSQIEQRDRKGMSLAFGPCGASVHTCHHAVWVDSITKKDISNVLETEDTCQLLLARFLSNVDTSTRPDRVSQFDSLHDALQEYYTDNCGNLRTSRQFSELKAAYDLLQINNNVAPSGIKRAIENVIDELKQCRHDRMLNLLPVRPRRDEGRFRVFETPRAGECRFIQCEDIPVALAMTISGAAFSTGLGARTSLATSLLCGLMNIRLGYWWDSGVEPGTRQNLASPGLLGRIESRLTDIFPVQVTLVQEMLGRFHGTARRWWYLSDGGHYENLGGYELIRRRIPWIIVSDAECDPDYTYDGMAKLVRTARIDFGAEIRFFSKQELDAVLVGPVRYSFGTPKQLRRGRWVMDNADDPHALRSQKRVSVEASRKSDALCHASLAWIFYPKPDGELEDKPGSILVYLKPTLNGDEPEDVRQYHAEHCDFPHETTLDQYFNEAQWESYRRLGLHIGDCVFEEQRDPGDSTPGIWFSDGKHTPSSVYRFSQSILAANPATTTAIDSNANWRVEKFEKNGNHYLSVRNLTEYDQPYRLENWLPTFVGGHVLEPRCEQYWHTAGERIMVPAHSRVVILAV